MKPSCDISNSASTQRHLNDEAQAAVIFLFVVGTIAILAVFIWLGPVMDGFSSFHNNATQGYDGHPAYLPVSQERQDAIFVTQIVWQNVPIITWILMIICSVIVALQWRTQNV